MSNQPNLLAHLANVAKDKNHIAGVAAYKILHAAAEGYSDTYVWGNADVREVLSHPDLQIADTEYRQMHVSWPSGETS